MSAPTKTIGIVGARGYVGAELVRLVEGHQDLQLSFVSSRALAGQTLSRVVPGCRSALQFENLRPAEVGTRGADIVVLALPNGLAADYVPLIPMNTVIVDLSADYRFDDEWYYGLPELTRERAGGRTRISNPGCYATAMQLALAPVCNWLAQPPVCFGVSGYSGAGTAPSDKNDPKVLANNIVPYKSVDHIHEREVSRQLGKAVHFLPNVAAFFRGIHMSVDAILERPFEQAEIFSIYTDFYNDEQLVTIQPQAPHVNEAVNRPGATVGGFTLDAAGTRLVVHSTLDNLLKGAATQALQNINLACGLYELEGISID